MVNRFLRTASTRRLLGTITGVVLVIGGGTAIAVAAQGSGPVPQPKQLARALHDAATAPQVQGITASISFTNRLINASELLGTDPLLSGGHGQVWISNTGQLRLELYGDNGDPELIVNNTSWWISDPTLKTVYEGTLPASSSKKDQPGKSHALPTVAQIQADLNKLMAHINVSGATPTDTGGQPTYTVTVSPKHAGGLLGQAQLAWDAIEGVPLRFAVYAHGDNTNPVLELAATGVSYGKIDPSTFDVPLPSGYKVVTVATPAGATAARKGAKLEHGKKQADVTGVRAVASQVPFKLVAPGELVGLKRQSASLLDTGGHHGALVTYGQGLGGIVVIEQAAGATGAQKLNLTNGAGDHAKGISLPTVSIDGASAQELDTALGTVVRFTRGGVSFTVLGSVPPTAADAAARAL